MKKSFSLIELLICLIVMSLLLVAFMPLITKKLKASDITVGSFGSNGGGIGIKRNVTKEDCDKLNAVFVEASSDVAKPLCVLKYNIGDMGNENWAGVQKCDAGDSTCKVKNGNSDKVTKDNLQPTCWQGKTAGNDCNDDFGGYDGCSRTVCNWTGGNQLCSNYSLKGTSGWRLPTFEELTSFTNNKYSSKSAYESQNGSLMLCDYASNSISPICPDFENKCTGTFNNNCYPYDLWSSSFDSTSIGMIRFLSWDKWHDNADYLGHALSVRCVLDSISDIVPPDGGTDVIDNKLDSQADCDKLGAGLLFIPKETTGTKNMCVMKYNIGDMGNENWAGVQRCTAGAACTVENGNSDKVTKDNLTPTCWQGKTGGEDCNADFGGYSGCNRTLCNWTAANKLCENYRLGTYGWRLPTFEELKSFTNDTYSSKTAFENKGKSLMFCTLSKSTIYPVCSYIKDNCPGTHYGHCDSRNVWSSSSDTTSMAKYRYLDSEWHDNEHYLGHGFSTRCVLDEDAYRHANTNQIMPTETEFSSSCENGCALCADDKCYACKQGYELKNGKCETHCLTMNNGICASCKKGYALLNGKCLTCDPSNGFVKVDNLCVMQYNIGNGYYKETWGGVQKCIAGQDCTVQNGSVKSATKDNLTPTCWQGKTGGEGCNANFGGYDGCTRTVCNWTGANQMCTNIGWRLPTINELETFANNEFSNKELGSNGLMFCDFSPSTISPVCTFLGGGCKNAYYGDCNPHDIWSSTFETTSLAWYRSMNENYWTNYNFPLGRGFSARCVYDL